MLEVNCMQEEPKTDRPMTDGGPKRHTKTYADIAASDGGPDALTESNSRALTEACVWPRSKQPPDDEVKWNSCAVLLV